MKQIKITFIAFTLLLGTFARADEGMWLPFLLGRNYEDMKKHGLNLSEEEIYSINNSSLKDAIVSFGGFCTGEIISKQGLILTNHHCGYDAIAEASTSEHNYLDNGFWAKNNAEEIPVLVFNPFNKLHAIFQARPKTKFNDRLLVCLLAAVAGDRRPRIVDVNVSTILGGRNGEKRWARAKDL